MCLSGMSGSEAHGDEVMVLVASLSTVLGDRGSQRDLCVGWFSMLICSEVRRRRGSRGAGQGPERPCLPGRFAGVCSDFYGMVCVTRKRRISTSPCGAVEHSCPSIRGKANRHHPTRVFGSNVVLDN